MTAEAAGVSLTSSSLVTATPCNTTLLYHAATTCCYNILHKVHWLLLHQAATQCNTMQHQALLNTPCYTKCICYCYTKIVHKIHYLILHYFMYHNAAHCYIMVNNATKCKIDSVSSIPHSAGNTKYTWECLSQKLLCTVEE